MTIQDKIDRKSNKLSAKEVNKRKPTAFDKIIADGLMAIRKKRSLTQQDLGDKLGVSSEMIRKYENSESRLPFGRAYEIASILGIKLEEFFTSLKGNNEKYELSDNQQELIEHYGKESSREKSDLEDLEKAYYAITDQKKRASFVKLVKDMSKNFQD